VSRPCGLDGVLRPVWPYLGDPLISPACIAEIAAVARQLPAGMSAFAGFECRLGAAEARADFSVCTMAVGGERESLAGAGPAGPRPDGAPGDDPWARVRRFAAAWASPGSPLHAHVGRVWLEFDVAERSAPLPAPNVFFGPAPPLERPTAGDAGHAWVSTTALPALRGAGLPPAIRRRLGDCLAALPDGAGAFQVGLMLARPTDAVRVCVAGLDPAAIPEYLGRIGWGGPRGELDGVLERFGRQADRIGLAIDVGETVGPRIGLECFLGGPIRSLPRWRPFLDELVEAGLCRPDKRAALLRYPGYLDDRGGRDLWPEHLLRVSSFLEARVRSVVCRWLHHVKLSYEAGRPLEAKAYLAARHMWVRPAQAEADPEEEGSRVTG
jgi:hypothetical protein